MGLPTISATTLAGMGDASADFARRVSALDDLARRILAARAAGDDATAATLQAEFKRRLGTADLTTLAQDAKAKDMPADWLLQLAGVSDWMTQALKVGVGLGIVYALYALSRGRHGE